MSLLEAHKYKICNNNIEAMVYWTKQRLSIAIVLIISIMYSKYATNIISNRNNT